MKRLLLVEAPRLNVKAFRMESAMVQLRLPPAPMVNLLRWR